MNNKGKAYHGTVLERPLIPTEEFFEKDSVFEGVSSDMNELNAFFVSQNEAVCEFFSDRKVFDEENQMQAVIKTETTIHRILEADFKIGRTVEYDGVNYNYQCNDERIKLFNQLRKDGFQAFVMRNDYEFEGEGLGDDIAIFDPSCVVCTEARLKINGAWTEYMPIELAKVKFKQWGMGEDLENGMETDYDSYFQPEFSY